MGTSGSSLDMRHLVCNYNSWYAPKPFPVILLANKLFHGSSYFVNLIDLYYVYHSSENKLHYSDLMIIRSYIFL